MKTLELTLPKVSRNGVSIDSGWKDWAGKMPTPKEVVLRGFELQKNLESIACSKHDAGAIVAEAKLEPQQADRGNCPERDSVAQAVARFVSC